MSVSAMETATFWDADARPSVEPAVMLVGEESETLSEIGMELRKWDTSGNRYLCFFALHFLNSVTK